MLYPAPIAKLIDSYSKLPGIGIKTATRLAFYTIGMSDDDVNEFAKNLLAAKRELTYCSICGNLTDDDPCAICTDETREQYTTGDIKSIGLRAEDETIAHHLFAILRDFDEDGVEVIYSEAFDTPRMGQAIMNRLLKAAGHKVAEV